MGNKATIKADETCVNANIELDRAENTIKAKQEEDAGGTAHLDAEMKSSSWSSCIDSFCNKLSWTIGAVFVGLCGYGLYNLFYPETADLRNERIWNERNNLSDLAEDAAKHTEGTTFLTETEKSGNFMKKVEARTFWKESEKSEPRPWKNPMRHYSTLQSKDYRDGKLVPIKTFYSENDLMNSLCLAKDFSSKKNSKTEQYRRLEKAFKHQKAHFEGKTGWGKKLKNFKIKDEYVDGTWTEAEMDLIGMSKQYDTIKKLIDGDKNKSELENREILERHFKMMRGGFYRNKGKDENGKYQYSEWIRDPEARDLEHCTVDKLF